MHARFMFTVAMLTHSYWDKTYIYLILLNWKYGILLTEIRANSKHKPFKLKNKKSLLSYQQKCWLVSLKQRRCLNVNSTVKHGDFIRVKYVEVWYGWNPHRNIRWW